MRRVGEVAVDDGTGAWLGGKAIVVKKQHYGKDSIPIGRTGNKCRRSEV